MKSGQRKKMLAKIKQVIPNTLAVYQFGSSVEEKKMHIESDVDLAILSSKKINPVILGRLMDELQSIIKRKVDVIDLSSTSTIFKSEVAYHGRRLLCKNKNACNQFEMNAISQLAFLNDEQRELIADIKKRGNIYG